MTKREAVWAGGHSWHFFSYFYIFSVAILGIFPIFYIFQLCACSFQIEIATGLGFGSYYELPVLSCGL